MVDPPVERNSPVYSLMAMRKLTGTGRLQSCKSQALALASRPGSDEAASQQGQKPSSGSLTTARLEAVP